MRRLRIKIIVSLAAVLVASISVACRSHGIDVTIQNNASVPLRNVEVDYPGAAFGTGLIAPGASFWYHIKTASTGDVTLSFEQPDGKMIRQKQGSVHAGDSGRLIIIVEQDANQKWHTRVEKK